MRMAQGPMDRGPRFCGVPKRVANERVARHTCFLGVHLSMQLMHHNYGIVRNTALCQGQGGEKQLATHYSLITLSGSSAAGSSWQFG